MASLRLAPLAPLAALLLTPLAASAGETLLRADFDSGSAVAAAAAGDPQPLPGTVGLPTAVPGIVGQALQLSAPERPLTYRARGNLDLQQGSLLFWLQPVGWGRDTLGFTPLLTIGTAKGYGIHYFLYYLASAGGERNLDWRARYEGKEYCLTDRESVPRSREVLAPGQWTHFALTWNGNQFMIYVNGEKGGEQTYGLPIVRGEPAAEDALWFMPNPFWKEEPRERRPALIDELEVLSRALAPEEIRGRYRRVRFHDTTPVVREPLLLRCAPHAESNELELRWDLTGCADERLRSAVAAGTAGGEAVLQALPSRREYARGRFAVTAAEGSARVRFHDLPPGRYQARLRVSGGGAELVRASSFERPDPGFLTAQVGLDRTVPAPWTPIRSSGQEVSVLGRTYLFDGRPFPSRMASEGQTVLARAVDLSVSVQGTARSFPAGIERTVEQAPDRVVAEGSSVLGDGSLRLRWRRELAYDGLACAFLTLEPAHAGARVPVDRLTFEAAVPAAAARFSFPYSAAWAKEGKAAARNDLAWLTNHRAGLCWFTDSDANWVYAASPDTPDTPVGPPVSLFRRGEEAIIQAVLIGRPVVIDRPLTYTMGLIATPTKPLRPDWRRIHAEGWRAPKGQTLQSVCWMDAEKIQFTNRWLLGDLVEEDAGRRELAEYKALGIDCVPYACGSAMPTNNPWYDFYETQWEVTHQGRPAPKDYRTLWRGREVYLGSVCPASGFGDWMVTQTDHLMRKYPFAGLYLDYGHPSPCDNPRHGCGVVDAFGQRRGSYNILGKRRMYERLYKVIHRVRPDGYLWTHNWLNFCPPLHSFTDLDFPGEEFMHTAPGNPNAYTDLTSPEEWQCNYNSHIRGVGIQFLSEVANGLQQMRDEPRRSRPMLTCLLLHDVPCNGNRVHWATISRLWAVWDTLEVTRATFHGYWEDDAPVRASAPELRVSTYTWPGERRALLVVGNMTTQAQRGTLDCASLVPAGAAVVARDEETEQPLSLGETLQLADRDYRLISVRW